MNNNSDAVIEECINKLQGLIGVSSSSSPSPVASSGQPKSVNIAQFDSKFAHCIEKANSLGP